MKYKTVIVSDIHMGYRASKVAEVSRFLSAVECDRLILNGDIIDYWQLKRSGNRRWNGRYTALLKSVLDKMESGNTEVVYVVGNHDDFLRHVAPLEAFDIKIVFEYMLESKSGRFFVTHGHIFDNISMNKVWLAKLGDLGYRILLVLNYLYNQIRHMMGKPYYSFAKAIKQKVKENVAEANKMDEMLVSVARSHGCDGVICGHVHRPEDRMVNGVRYLNCGDWVESMTALVEDDLGNFSIINYSDIESEL